jgi:hypothetical protein
MQLFRVDLPRLAIGSAVAAALGVGLAAALFNYAEATPDVGPTSGALDDGLSTLLGAGLGLAVGSALAASIVRRGSRWFAGVAAGVVAYVLVLIPVLVFTRPSDVGLGETAGFALFLVLPLGLFVLVGATLGSSIAQGFDRRRSGTSGGG